MGTRAVKKDPTSNAVVALIVCGMVVILGMIAAVVGLELAGREVENVLYLIAAVLIPTAVGVFNSIQNNQTKQAVNQVQHQTNGRFTEITKNNQYLASEITKRDDESIKRFIREELDRHKDGTM